MSKKLRWREWLDGFDMIPQAKLLGSQLYNVSRRRCRIATIKLKG